MKVLSPNFSSRLFVQLTAQRQLSMQTVFLSER